MAAMTMVASMQTRRPHVAVVARELALTLYESCLAQILSGKRWFRDNPLIVVRGNET